MGSFFAATWVAFLLGWLAMMAPQWKRNPKFMAWLAMNGTSLSQMRWALAGLSVTSLIIAAIALAPPAVTNQAAAPTATATADGSEALYLARMAEQIKNLRESMGRFVKLASEPRLDDVQWKIEIAGVFAGWRVTYQEAAKVGPPERFQALNAEYVETLRQLDEAGRDYAGGMDSRDVEELERANDELHSASEGINQLDEQFREIQASAR